MEVNLKPGKYILAVSGGVDSVVLLDMLAKDKKLDFIVAHLDHGIRPNSDEDRRFVKNLAKSYAVSYESAKVELGSAASEESARKARYVFLEKIAKKHNADAIVTAHHRDDFIETAAINMLRGTGHRGIGAINSSKIVRPLLGIKKEDIYKYAEKNNLQWREDETNKNDRYLRNKLRKNLNTRFTKGKRRRLEESIDNVANNSVEINTLIAKISQNIILSNVMDRYKYNQLPVDVSRELLTYWLRDNDLRDFDSQKIKMLDSSIRTAKSGTTHNVYGNRVLKVSTDGETISLDDKQS